MGKDGFGRWRFFILWLEILSLASATAQVHGQADFLNIDCGKEEGYSDTDSILNLTYTSDHQYVSTGEIHNVDPSYRLLRYYNQAYDLRSFPDGKRNCYTLPLKRSRKYLARASFLYGNYDGQNKLPQFVLYVGVNYWQSVLIFNASALQFAELVFATGDKASVDLCLVNTEGGTPFISSLELRPLPDDLYPPLNASRMLMPLSRFDVGGTTFIRYPTDIYDRIWYPSTATGWTGLTTSYTVDTTSNQPPSDVLNNAMYPAGSSMNFSFEPVLDTSIAQPRAHVFLYFAELRLLMASESRVFDVYVNGIPIRRTVKPPYLKGLTVQTIDPVNLDPFYVNLEQTLDSTLPPILNAGEIILVRDLTGVETALLDGMHLIIHTVFSYDILKVDIIT